MKALIRGIIQYRKTVLALTAIITLGLVVQLKSLKVIIDPDSILPQTHPFVSTGYKIKDLFGTETTAVIGIHPKKGDIFQPSVLKKLMNITERLENSPNIVKSSILSLSSRKAKSITGNQEGMMVTPIMDHVPSTPEEIQQLKVRLEKNPIYRGLLVSEDQSTALIVAEFKKTEGGGFKSIQDSVEQAVLPERDENVDMYLSGVPSFLSLLEKYSARMGFLFPLALLIIGLIHYEAFRTRQALILPLVTAMLAVAWAVGILGLMKEPLDVFNSATPILILAIAAGHAVQILKRYYEEFSTVKKDHPELSGQALSELAVLNSLTKVGPVMIVACTVAALGFFSLMIFDIKSIRTFGIFTGSGVISALILELTFIPALRVMLPPPGNREIAREKEDTFWDRLVGRFYQLAMNQRKKVYAVVGILIVVLSLGGKWLVINNSQKAYFYGKITERLDDDVMNSKMAGTNTAYVMVEGPNPDSIKRPDVLKAMDSLQRYIETQPSVGKTISIVDFIKKMNQSMNADQKEMNSIPSTQELVAQYLFLYSNSGEPGDFDSYIDNDYQRGLITTFLKTDSSLLMEQFSKNVSTEAKRIFPSDIKVSMGGGSLVGAALNEIMIHEKVLNILQIMGTVFFISSIVFRSLFAGMLILVPLIAAVMVNFGVMGLLGIPLQIATSLVSAMAVGIGADYGIYMSYRMREELKKVKVGDPDAEKLAIEKAFSSAGKATLFVSSAVAGGFGVLMFSWGFLVHNWMGFLIAISMLVSSITALTLFPALIFSFRPKFIFQNNLKEKMSMNSKLTTVMVIAAFISAMSVMAAPSVEKKNRLNAVEIAKKSFSASKVDDSTSDSTFRLINSSGQERLRETTGFTKLIPGTEDNRRVVTFLTPTDVKGTKTLLVEHSGSDDDLWIYLPALKKVRRLVSSNKKDSFVGTDFSYGDVVGQRPEEWSHQFLREEVVDGRKCFVLESTPKKESTGKDAGYSKQIGWIDQESFVNLKGESYDLNGKLLKKFSARKIEKVDSKKGKWVPMVIEAENVQTNHKTIIEFKNYKANQGVSDEYFSSRYLEK